MNLHVLPAGEEGGAGSGSASSGAPSSLGIASRACAGMPFIKYSTALSGLLNDARNACSTWVDYNKFHIRKNLVWHQNFMRNSRNE